MKWTEEAKRRLARAPFFVRPFIKRRAETVARERGMAEVTEALLSELKGKEHTGS
jgi:hypothetical protein